ncbi:hypothetical protein MTR_5g025360 [Medicago truncatula]|uniref:Uncharacterized protein n=1 Tax=Medicago truncatula TaxID=3880 RepID=G7K3Z5_MEDTR|nr:hypothetical protein MTR_5g025360 [Medicago truncatula]
MLKPPAASPRPQAFIANTDPSATNLLVSRWWCFPSHHFSLFLLASITDRQYPSYSQVPSLHLQAMPRKCLSQQQTFVKVDFETNHQCK